MNEVYGKELSWRDEPSMYGSNPLLLFLLATTFEIGELVVEFIVGELALLGDYRVRRIDSIFLKKKEPD